MELLVKFIMAIAISVVLAGVWNAISNIILIKQKFLLHSKPTTFWLIVKSIGVLILVPAVYLAIFILPLYLML